MSRYINLVVYWISVLFAWTTGSQQVCQEDTKSGRLLSLAHKPIGGKNAFPSRVIQKEEVEDCRMRYQERATDSSHTLWVLFLSFVA